MQAVTAAILAAAADILAQRISSRARLNWRRTLSIALYGLVWGGPSNHYWQIFLEKLFTRKNDPLRPIKKVLFDQTTYGPLCNILFMLYISMVVEGRKFSTTRSKIMRDYPSVQVNGWRLWPVAQLINQSFLPLDLRVLFGNAVALVWTTFMITRAKTAGALGKSSSAPLLKLHAKAS